MIFIVDEKMHQSALHGFTDRYGYEYKGVYELLGEYYNCTEEGFCDYTEDEEMEKGRVTMDNIVI